MTYEEYTQVQEEYEELQMDYLDAQTAYSEILYSFDRLTCGALSAYFQGEAVSMSAAEGGRSYVVEDEGDGIYYFIHTMVDNNLFELGLSMPDDPDTEITDYELWVNDKQIGARTSVDKTIRHLALDMKETGKVFLRLYQEEDFVDDCEIDASVYSEKLTIRTYHTKTAEDLRIGTYTLEKNALTGMLELTLALDADQMAVSYNVKTSDGKYLVSSRRIPVKDRFRYLAAAENSQDELIICLYDEEGALLCEAQMQSIDQTLQKKEEGYE